MRLERVGWGRSGWSAEEGGEDSKEGEGEEDEDGEKLDVERGRRAVVGGCCARLSGTTGGAVEAAVAEGEGCREPTRRESALMKRESEERTRRLTLRVSETSSTPSTTEEHVEEVLRVDFLSSLEATLAAKASSSAVERRRGLTRGVGVASVAVEDGSLVRVRKDLEGF